MFSFALTYLRRELGHRAGRATLTVLGLAVGVALVIVVTALSDGLDQAQSEILDPLTGVGTDLVVSRPITVEGADGPERIEGQASFAQLSREERDALR
ncbi:MAG: ABC transporter permease, partial [Solirubrobacterales bacterium]